ncbi:hypothetical protein V8C42DRAFT_242932 [Trichoderma barbatum]
MILQEILKLQLQVGKRREIWKRARSWRRVICFIPLKPPSSTGSSVHQRRIIIYHYFPSPFNHFSFTSLRAISNFIFLINSRRIPLMADFESGHEGEFESGYESQSESEPEGDINEPDFPCIECVQKLSHKFLTKPQRADFRANSGNTPCAICNQRIGARQEEYYQKRFPNLAKQIVRIHAPHGPPTAGRAKRLPPRSHQRPPERADGGRLNLRQCYDCGVGSPRSNLRRTWETLPPPAGEDAL